VGMWALDSETSKKMSEYLRFREPHCHSARRPISRESQRIFAQTLYF